MRGFAYIQPMLFAHRRVQCGFRERADPLRTTATACSKNASCSLCGNGHKTGVGSRLVYQILQPPTAVPVKAAARRARNFSVAPTLGETVARRVRASVRQTARRRTSRRAQGAKHNSGLTFSAQQVSQIASVRLTVGSGMLTSWSPPNRAIDLGSAHLRSARSADRRQAPDRCSARYRMETTS